jgi:GT2 family glycosyltransferase
MGRASVCIPTRNRAQRLRLTLESLNAQSVDPDRFEVIVADDGSTDGTAEMLRGFASRYTLRWTRLSGRGSGAARNAAAGAAKNDVLIFLDDDQIASVDLVATHLSAQERIGPAIVQGDYPLADGWDRNGASIVFERSRRKAVGASRRSDLLSLWGGNFSVPWSAWLEAGGFDESLLRHQDLDFGLRIVRLGVPLVMEPRALSRHLHRVDSDAFRRQCFDEGFWIARIERKHNLHIGSATMARPIDGVVQACWRRYPRQAIAIGRCLGAMLRIADFFRLRPAQVFTARLVGRFHRLGGVALAVRTESASPWAALSSRWAARAASGSDVPLPATNLEM